MPIVSYKGQTQYIILHPSSEPPLPILPPDLISKHIPARPIPKLRPRRRIRETPQITIPNPPPLLSLPRIVPKARLLAPLHRHPPLLQLNRPLLPHPQPLPPTLPHPIPAPPAHHVAEPHDARLAIPPEAARHAQHDEPKHRRQRDIQRLPARRARRRGNRTVVRRLRDAHARPLHLAPARRRDVQVDEVLGLEEAPRVVDGERVPALRALQLGRLERLLAGDGLVDVVPDDEDGGVARERGRVPGDVVGAAGVQRGAVGGRAEGREGAVGVVADGEGGAGRRGLRGGVAVRAGGGGSGSGSGGLRVEGCGGAGDGGEDGGYGRGDARRVDGYPGGEAGVICVVSVWGWELGIVEDSLP